ncbi:hypothetical protein EYF80_035388 [Liparis tanakae]|uniref:Uncharacterized protein n=1 Tax=Liparis tanakae TaxID=230148 RepID=A0A4Z2GM65_9TELE|nr:hypothetical protein EYF80_035388 [Liparis tanakae]
MVGPSIARQETISPSERLSICLSLPLEDFKGEAGQGLREAMLSRAADVHAFILAEDTTKQEALLRRHHTFVQLHLVSHRGSMDDGVRCARRLLLAAYRAHSDPSQAQYGSLARQHSAQAFP